MIDDISSCANNPENGQIAINETARALADDLGIDNPLMVSDQGPAPSAGDVGVVRSVNVSSKKGMRKAPVESGVIELIADFGVAADAHACDWHRQVSFLAEESIQTACEFGFAVGYGDFTACFLTPRTSDDQKPDGCIVGLHPIFIFAANDIGCHGLLLRLPGRGCLMPEVRPSSKKKAASLVKAPKPSCSRHPARA